MSEEKEKEENMLRAKIFCPWMRRKKRRRKGRKIFGEGRGRGTEKEKEENILGKESDDGQTNTQNFLLSNRFCRRGPAKHYVL